MNLIAHLTAAAGLAVVALAAAPAPAEAQYRGGHAYDRGWNGPEGHFVVYAQACPDLREDFRDRRRSYGRHRGGRGDWRDRRVLECPPHAWDYVPSRRELRMGRTGERLQARVAYYDRRTGQYFVETRWNAVPVQIVYGYGHHDRRHDRGYDGWRFSWSHSW